MWEENSGNDQEAGRQDIRTFFADGIRETLTVNSPALYQAENAAIAYMAAIWVFLRGKTRSVPSTAADAVVAPDLGDERSVKNCKLFSDICIPPNTPPQDAASARKIEHLASSYTSLRTILQHALARSVWEGRFEEVRPGVYLDGAHNADGIRALLASLPAVVGNRPVTLLFTAVKEKDTNEMIREICASGLFGRYLVTTVGGARAIAPEELKKQFLAHTNAPVAAYASPQEAFRAGLELVGGEEATAGDGETCPGAEDISSQTNGVFLCAGSLYLVGMIKELLSSVS